MYSCRYVAPANHISKSVDGGGDGGGRAIEETNKQAKESGRETAGDEKRSVTTFPDPSSFGARLVYICVPRGCILADGDVSESGLLDVSPASGGEFGQKRKRRSGVARREDESGKQMIEKEGRMDGA